MHGPQQIHAGRNQEHLHKLLSEDYDKDIPGLGRQDESQQLPPCPPISNDHEGFDPQLHTCQRRHSPQQIHAGRNQEHLHKLLSEDYDKDIPGLGREDESPQLPPCPTQMKDSILTCTHARDVTALSKSMLAEIKSIFTSCFRRITTKTSLGSDVKMNLHNCRHAHRSQTTMKDSTLTYTHARDVTALSKSMLAEIKSIFTSCFRRITTKTSLGSDVKMNLHNCRHAHRSQTTMKDSTLTCTHARDVTALSKSMLAEIKSIFTSCFRRITTKTSLGSGVKMNLHNCRHAHRSQTTMKDSTLTCTHARDVTALSKSMLAEIKSIFTSCFRRITTKTSLGSDVKMSLHNCRHAHRSQTTMKDSTLTCTHARDATALSKSMLAEIKSIFTSCFRRITTKTSLGSDVKMNLHNCRHAHRSQTKMKDSTLNSTHAETSRPSANPCWQKSRASSQVAFGGLRQRHP